MGGRTLIPIVLLLILGYVFYVEIFSNDTKRESLFGDKKKNPITETKKDASSNISAEQIAQVRKIAETYLANIRSGNLAAAVSLYAGPNSQGKLAEVQRQQSDLFGRLQNYQLVSYAPGNNSTLNLRYNVTYQKTNTSETFTIALGTFASSNFSPRNRVGGSAAGNAKILAHQISSNVF